MDDLVELLEKLVSGLKRLQEKGDCIVIPDNPKEIFVAKDGEFYSSIHFNSIPEVYRNFTHSGWKVARFVEVL